MNKRLVNVFLLLFSISSVFINLHSMFHPRPWGHGLEATAPVEIGSSTFRPRPWGQGVKAMGFWSSARKNTNISEPVDRLPLVYDAGYNISFFGVEKYHSFDTRKYEKIYKFLVKSGIKQEQFVKPVMVTDEQLLFVHSQEYLDSLKDNCVIARIVGLLPLVFLPDFANFIVKKKLLNPVKLAVGGTLCAVDLALQHGWAINLAGGYPHAKRNEGGGFCFFSDIALAVNKVKEQKPGVKVMIVDLDVHQCNGPEDYFCDDLSVVIFDIYQQDTYPRDSKLWGKITYGYPLVCQWWYRGPSELAPAPVDDELYLSLLSEKLGSALDESKPDFIIYNAGTDIYEKDKLGGFRVTKEGIIARDLYVFQQARQRNIPIIMTLSGGFHADSAGIVADSIKNLLAHKEMLAGNVVDAAGVVNQ